MKSYQDKEETTMKTNNVILTFASPRCWALFRQMDSFLWLLKKRGDKPTYRRDSGVRVPAVMPLGGLAVKFSQLHSALQVGGFVWRRGSPAVAVL